MQLKNVRFIIAAITTFSAYAVYVSRVNLSIAIIGMVDDGNHADDPHNQTITRPINSQAANLSEIGWTNQNLSTSNQVDKLHREPMTTIFPASEKSVRRPLIHRQKFDWDQVEQGHILGAFFYGYILFQIPGARMAESVGAKWIIMAANAGSALVSLIFPLSTQLNSIHLLMVLRFVMGLCQSAFFPAAYVLFCRWLPEGERAILLPIMFVGSNIGSISTYIMSSYLISTAHGWPSVFYVSGGICTIVTLLWFVFGSNGPEDNWFITEDERHYIEGHINDQSSERCSFTSDNDQTSDQLDKNWTNNNNNMTIDVNVDQQQREQKLVVSDETNKTSDGSQISWWKLCTSVPVWTLILSMYGNEWSNVVLCYELPTYLNTALKIPIEQNGVINSFFQLSYALVSPIMSSLGAYMLDHHVFGMRKIHVRKLFQSLALFGQLACFISVPICGNNRGLIIMFMFSAIVFKSCANAGDIMISGDLSPEFAGTIFACANSIGNTAGFFVPLLAGSFIVDAHDRGQWEPFWFTTAAIMGTSGLIFLIFGQTNHQELAKDKKHIGLDEPHENGHKMLVLRDGKIGSGRAV